MPATMKMIERENEISEIHEAKQRFRREMEEKLYEFDVKIWIKIIVLGVDDRGIPGPSLG